MKGYIIALDKHIKNKSFIVFSDWSFSVHSSSACLLVKIHDKDGTTVLPAVAESQTLSDSLRAKGSSLCEMGALISALPHLRPILFLAPFVVYVDNLALCNLINRRFATNKALDSNVAQRLLLSVEDRYFQCKFVPSELQLYDGLSRIKLETGKSVDELLTNSNQLADVDYVESMLRLGKDKENETQFFERSERNIDMIRRVETEMGDTRDVLYQLFKRTQFSHPHQSRFIYHRPPSLTSFR